MFGGVPTGVAIPPIVAENARPNSRAGAKAFLDSFKKGFNTSIKAKTADNNITAVAVLLIQLLIQNALSITPAKIRLGCVPVFEIIQRAHRK